MNRPKLSCACVCAITVLISPAVFAQTSQLYNGPQSNESYTAPTQRDNLRTAATNINFARSNAFARGDSASIAALYTADAVYVELMPRLIMMNGRRLIKAHFDELFAQKATELDVSVTSAEMTSPNTQLVAGDYAISSVTKRIMGHFVQTLRLEDGVWKISSHVFARPESLGEYQLYTADQP